MKHYFSYIFLSTFIPFFPEKKAVSFNVFTTLDLFSVFSLKNSSILTLVDLTQKKPQLITGCNEIYSILFFFLYII